MKQPAQIRALVLTRVMDMLKHLCLQVSMYAPAELEVLKTLEYPQRDREAEALAQFVMGRLGAVEPKVQEPRFDKLHRAVVKKRGRPPRGVKSAGEPRASDALEAKA